MNRNLKHRLICTYLLSIFTVSSAVAPAWAANLFSWNADQLSTTSLGKIIGIGGATSIDTTEKNEGTGSMKLSVPGDQQYSMGIEPGNSDIGPGADGGSLYYRWWMKIDSNFSWGNATAKLKSNRIKRQGDVLPGIMTMYLRRDSVYAGECAQCEPGGDDPSNAKIGYNFKPATNPAVSNWQEYIIHIKKQTDSSSFDGEFHFYVNGVEVGSGVKGMNFYTGTVNWVEAWGAYMVRPYPQLNDPSAGGTIWVDDFSLDTTFNSNFANGGGDITPPSAPTGLTVQ